MKNTSKKIKCEISVDALFDIALNDKVAFQTQEEVYKILVKNKYGAEIESTIKSRKRSYWKL